MAEPEFTRSARQPATLIEDPILQWASGLQTQDKRIYAGWLLEAGKHEALDLSMHEAGFGQVTIKHGSGAIVTHWAVETATAFVIADGVQSPQEMRRTSDRFGIAYGWRTREDGKRQSHLKMRVLLRELLMVNCYEALTISLKSTMTDDLLHALMLQYDVLWAVDEFRTVDGRPVLHPPFYACSLPLCAGAEVTRGKNGQTKEIAPPIAALPNPVTREYIMANWIKRDWTAHIEAIIDGTIQWSVEESQRISGGVEQATDEVSQ